MKKIDLHIHTVPTISDSAFTFSLDTFKRYVKEARLDSVAVTNHDIFDGTQFRLNGTYICRPLLARCLINDRPF